MMLLRTKLIQRLIFVGLCVFSDQALATKYTFPIHAFGVTESNVTISVDDDSLVPSLMSMKLTEQNIDSILPYRGSAESRAIVETVLSRKELSFGSTAFYFYLAVNLAFDRIYRNLILFDRDISKEGFSAAVDSSRFANFRRLAQLKPIKSANLNIDVYSDKDKFDERSAAIGLHTARAFWDSQNNTIGIYFDNRIFRWVQTQSAVTGQSEQEIAIHIQNYISRRVIDTISHELVHFIQQASDSAAARNAFFSELVAVFIQENIYVREERSLIASVHTGRGLPLKPWLKPCAELWQDIPQWSVQTLVRLDPALKQLHESQISIEKLINLDETQFYSQGPQELAREYVLFNPFAAFLMSMRKEEFEGRFSGLIDRRGTADVQGLDAAFQDFIKKSDRSFAGQGGDAMFKQVRDAVTFCLNNHDFISAHTGSLKMVDFAPANILGVVYMGDVFFNSNNAYFALDYYDMAYNMQRPETSAADRVLTISRLADAFETLGDAELAAGRLKEIRGFDPDAFPFETAIVLQRSQLKLALYSYAEQMNKKPAEIAPLLVEMYVHALQGWECGSEADKATMHVVLKKLESGDETGARSTLRTQFEHVRQLMLNELAGSDWISVLNQRLSMCK